MKSSLIGLLLLAGMVESNHGFANPSCGHDEKAVYLVDDYDSLQCQVREEFVISASPVISLELIDVDPQLGILAYCFRIDPRATEYPLINEWMICREWLNFRIDRPCNIDRYSKQL